MRPTEAQEKKAITKIDTVRLGPTTDDQRDREEQEREGQHDVHEAGQDACRPRRRSSRPPSRRRRRRRRRAASTRTPTSSEIRARRRSGPAGPGRGCRCRAGTVRLGPTGSPSGDEPGARGTGCTGRGRPRWAMSGAPTAIRTSNTIATAEAIATGSRRSRAQASRPGLRPSIGPLPRPPAGSARSARERRSRSTPTRGRREHGRAPPAGAVICPPCVAGPSAAAVAGRPPTGKWQAVRWVGGSPGRTTSSGSSIGAARLRLRAARMEPAARRRVDRRRHVADEHDPLPPVGEVRIGDRRGRQQRRRVRVAGAVVERLGVGDLDDLAEVHHRDAVADVPDDGQVVGDEDVGEAELAAADR